MYAAAGGASIASRKARQKQVKGAPPPKKVPPKGVKGQQLKTPQSKQFHQLPDNYHRHAEEAKEGGGLAPPAASLHHSRSLTPLRPDDEGPGLRPSRSAHELPLDPGLEPGAGATGSHSLLPSVHSPPRAYSCTHWESRLLKVPPPSGDRIVAFGSTDVPFTCAQGKAAWQEAAAAGVTVTSARRCSVVADGAPGTLRTKQTEAHLRWMKRNRIHDSSYGGSSDEEDGLRARAVNAAGSLLYVGLGTVALGLVISFVGTGDKGFKTLELRWTGPALICAGLVCCILRIMLCICPGRCLGARPDSTPKEPAAERLLLTERPPPPPRKLAIAAAAALAIQHERDFLRRARSPVTAVEPPTPETPATPPAPAPTPAPVPVVPLVMLSKENDDSLIELRTMDGSSVDISSISSSDISIDNLTVIENAEPTEAMERSGKLSRTREPMHARKGSTLGIVTPRTVTFADTPNIIAPPSEAPPPAAEIVLTPSSLSR